MDEYVISTHGLTKQYARRAVVDNVDLSVKKGEIYGLIGKNGAGKTTIMRMLLGLALPTGGRVEIFGKPFSTKSLARVGSLIEAPALYTDHTAEENLKRFAIIKGADPSCIPALLKRVGLSDTGSKKAGQFSLGMRQRLGIAIAMLGKPELLILDEPVNGLDPAGMKEVRDLILSLNREEGITVLISSHLLDELARTVHRYGIICEGHLVDELSVEELKERCPRELKIRVDDAARAEALLREYLGRDASCMTADGDTLTLRDRLEHSGEMNTLLVKNGITVFALEHFVTGEEDYLVNAMGGKA